MKRHARGATGAVAFATVVCLAGGCTHQGALARRPLSDSTRHVATEAGRIRSITCEEEFVEARLLFQALPREASVRAPLRRKILDYLLGPLAALTPDGVRKQAVDSASDDTFDKILDSFRDALDLFTADELWSLSPAQHPRLPAGEQLLLIPSARLVVALYAPRGAEAAVATGLFVLATLEPGSREWTEHLDQLLLWVEEAAEPGSSPVGPRPPFNKIDVLESVAAAWPAPVVASGLEKAYRDRQHKMSSLLRRPLGLSPGRGDLGSFLIEGVQSTAMDLAALYLRCGQLGQARRALDSIAGQPGDDAEIRQLVSAAASPGVEASDLLALARRFLPRLELLGGTSKDRIDPVVAARVLDLAIARFPREPVPLVLASRVARFVPAAFLSLRYLEEAEQILVAARAPSTQLADISSELLDLSFASLRVRIDPERIEPAAREAERLHKRFAESRQRFGASHLRLADADIDVELARGYVDAGLIERAETLFSRTGLDRNPAAGPEITLQIANLVLKQDQPTRAAKILRDALDRERANAPAQDTVGYIEGLAKLARALGGAYEAAGNVDEARLAWKDSLGGWQRLLGEYLRRKDVNAAAEATFELGRLRYLTGHRDEGIARFAEAIEQNESRDQSYTDVLSFLVQHGEGKAAQDIYRRAVSKPSRTVSEYVKVYASLWILDLSRRSGNGVDAAAEAYLKSVTARPLSLRPTRAAAWYMPLARFVIGVLSYERLQALADTPGKRAELYFYQAMRQLADGHQDDANTLWHKVLETRMFSFFEFEMAARYLRTGAPTARPAESTAVETI